MKHRTIAVSEKTHKRLREVAKAKGVVLYRFTDDLINTALDLREHTERRLEATR